MDVVTAQGSGRLDEHGTTGVAPHPRFGARCARHQGVEGVVFSVWAPHARRVSVIGDFNQWNPDSAPLQRQDWGHFHGVWTGFVPHAHRGQRYKYRIDTPDGRHLDKADPCATFSEPPPLTASRVWPLDYEWGDRDWMAGRAARNALNAPMSIYEVHLGSWQRDHDSPGQFLGYRELAHRLVDHVTAMGFTHVELMPVAEHPFYGSWGYQSTGYFAPSARYGTPQDLMYLVDTLHQHGIGVILDWVPSHFPADAHGLGQFDGTALYEHPDPRIGFHPQWNSLIFDYGKPQVRDFLIHNALYWLEYFHFDGLRVDAVASMLYLDFARGPGQWVPNHDGGNQNWAAVEFMKALNTAVYGRFPDVQVIAEESSSWEGVSKPVYAGGLGFGMKWNMGWMNDTLRHFQRPHFYRRYHTDEVRFSMWYHFNENFLLPLSHDEVVHGKGSLIGRQPGDEWQRFAGLRTLFGYMWGHPGKKLLFMGGEFAQLREWHHDGCLDWYLLERPLHAGVQRWVRDLNHYYVSTPALYADDYRQEGFAWGGPHDATVLVFHRRARGHATQVLVVCNLTPEAIPGRRIGVPSGGWWREALNSDSKHYGGTGMGNLGGRPAQPLPMDGHDHSITVAIPPLAVLFFEGDAP